MITKRFLTFFNLQELKKVARRHQLIQQVQLITYMENFFFTYLKMFPSFLQKFPRDILQGLRNTGGYRYVKILRSTEHTDKSLSVTLKKKIIDYTIK